MSAFKYLLVDDNGVICGTNSQQIADAAEDTGDYTVQLYTEIDEIEFELPEDEPEEPEDEDE